MFEYKFIKGAYNGLRTRIMVENFHRIGKYESLKMELKI